MSVCLLHKHFSLLLNLYFPFDPPSFHSLCLCFCVLKPLIPIPLIPSFPLSWFSFTSNELRWAAAANQQKAHYLETLTTQLSNVWFTGTLFIKHFSCHQPERRIIIYFTWSSSHRPPDSCKSRFQISKSLVKLFHTFPSCLCLSLA